MSATFFITDSWFGKRQGWICLLHSDKRSTMGPMPCLVHFLLWLLLWRWFWLMCHEIECWSSLGYLWVSFLLFLQRPGGGYVGCGRSRIGRFLRKNVTKMNIDWGSYCIRFFFFLTLSQISVPLLEIIFCFNHYFLVWIFK